MHAPSTEPPRGTPGIAMRNIDEIVRLEEAASQRRSRIERLADRIADFVGTVPFVALHLLWFAAWAAINLRLLPSLPAFDPYPFSLLCMIVAMEGVLLSSFVLIKQTRMSRRSDERGHLALQVALLTEQEVTKVIRMLDTMSARFGVQQHVVDDEARDLGRHTAVRELASRLRERLEPDR
jgi:uncharacterized membrane protein